MLNFCSTQVLGTNRAVLFDCSKSSRQCSLPSFLTYLYASCPIMAQTVRFRPSALYGL